jgi:predicted PurR-regulated permease PerM
MTHFLTIFVAVLAAAAVLAISITIAQTQAQAQALTQQEEINKLNQEAAQVAKEIKNIPDWMYKRTDRALQIQDGITKAFPNGIPKECEKHDSIDDTEHSYTMIIKCVIIK